MEYRHSRAGWTIGGTSMNMASLIGEFDRNGVDIESCSLNHGELIIENIGLGKALYGPGRPEGKWYVYFCSGSSRFDIMVFADESTACKSLLERVLRINALRKKYGRMDIDALKEEIALANIDSWSYSLDRSDDLGDQVVIDNDIEGRWTVSSETRGVKSNPITFTSQSEAYIHFLDRLIAAKERWDAISNKNR
jgi:hypothetical protein